MLLFLVNIASPAFAADAPLAELYFYNHGAVDGLAALNTTTYMSSTKSQITSAGYNCSAYTNIKAGPKSSASVIRTLADDAVFLISAHAGNGRVVCVDSSNNVTRLSANSQSASTNYSLAYNFDSTTDKLKSVKIAYWMGCNTYGTSSSYGSLNEKCESLGVDCVITHNTKTWPSYSNYFLYSFFYYGNQGYNVSTSLSKAKTKTLENYNYSGDTSSNLYITVSSYKISGANSSPGTVSLEPASYGQY